MEIVFITPEMTPYSRTGPIGDVCAALPRGLRGMDHKVTVVSPLWSAVDPTSHALARRLSTIPVDVGGQREQMTVFDGRTTGGVDLVFIGHDALLSGGPPESGRPASAQHLRASLAFGEAAIAVAKERSDAVQAVHGHGWFAAPALLSAHSLLPGARRILSLHDASARGVIDVESRQVFPDALLALAGEGDGANLLLAGAREAARVIASSQSAVQALLEAGDDLASALSEEGKLIGIAAGLDAARWNPLTDALLPARFDPVDRTGKQRCKDALQLELGVPVRPEVPLLVSVAGAGIELLLSNLDAILRNDVQLAVIGASGDALEQLDKLAEEHGERLALLELDDAALHRALAAADGLLVTGDGAQTAELHLSGQRYGALPIAPAVGAIADGVVDCDANLETGNGFLFELGDADSMLSAVQRALSGYTRRDAWSKLQNRTMRLDLSWDRFARRYEHCYKG